jgi:hypothetical protein
MWSVIAIVSFIALFTYSSMAIYALLNKTGRFRKNIFYAAMCCLLIIFAVKIAPQMNGYFSNEQDSAQKPNGAYAKSQVSVGEDGILNEDTFVSLGEDKVDFDTMQTYIAANDAASLKRMMTLGKVYLAAKGTEITLISKSFVRAKVEISSTGRIGLVPTVYISNE